MIVIRGLTKRYGDKVAINGLDLTVAEGEIFGFLGPNGAGKTTTVRIISTLSGFSGGSVTVRGYDISKDPLEAKRLMGVIQQHISLDKDLTVGENMMYHAMIRKIPRKERMGRIVSLAGRIGLGEYMDRGIDTLSEGWKRRTAIACALLHDPKILFLDEPTVGLDIQSRRVLWDLIRRLNDGGTTIFLTSHYIEEVEALCRTVGMIDNGRLVAYGSPAEFCERIGRIAVEFHCPGRATQYRYFRSRGEAEDFVSSLDGPCSASIRNTSLEDCFVEFTGKKAEGV